MPYLELEDCKLFYTVDDHTDPWTRPDSVLFVHGFTENTDAWRQWVDPDMTARTTREFIDNTRHRRASECR